MRALPVRRNPGRCDYKTLLLVTYDGHGDCTSLGLVEVAIVDGSLRVLDRSG